MKNVDEQKKKLEQKKSRLAIEETRLKLKERKMRTRHLIEVGGLVVKAKIDNLPTNTLYGVMLSLTKELQNNPDIKNSWKEVGKVHLDAEDAKTTPIITFTDQPEKEVRDEIRTLGLRWNKFRSEWYGTVSDLDALNNAIKNQTHNIEILKN
jgi:hypothetical protein